MKRYLIDEPTKGRTKPEGGTRRNYVGAKVSDEEFRHFNDLCKKFGIRKANLVRYALYLAEEELKKFKNRSGMKRAIKEEQAELEREAKQVEEAKEAERQKRFKVDSTGIENLSPELKSICNIVLDNLTEND